MPYLFFAWLASIVYGLEVIIGKLMTKHLINNPYLLNFVWSFLTIIFTLPLALINGVNFPQVWPNLFWTGFYYALSNLLYIVSLKLLDVSSMGPLFNFRVVFSVILAALMLGEKLTSVQFGLIGIIFVGGILVNLDEKSNLKSFLSPGVLPKTDFGLLPYGRW